VSVDFSVSPRLIEIALPSPLINIQDLYDTLRAIEARLHNLNFPALIDNGRSTGKQILSSTKQLGLTVTLRNALVKFADRPGPGHVNVEIRDGNLVSTDGIEPPTFIDPVFPAAFVNTKLELDVSAALISADVQDFWDALRAAHLVPGSFGALMGQPNMEKGVPFSNFPVVMLNATSLLPLAGLTVTGEFSIGTGLFATLTNSPLTEVELGKYVVTTLTAAETNGDEVTYRFTAPGAREELITIFPNPS
jgi:hypothetical protein